MKKIGSLSFFFIENNIDGIFIYYYLIKNNYVVALLDRNIESKLKNDLIKKYLPNYIITKKILKTEKYYKLQKLSKNYNIYNQVPIFQHKLHKELCLLMSTSVATGSPKLVKLSNTNLISNTKSIIKSLNIKSNDRTITTLEPFYTFGLSIINTHILKKSKIIINSKNFFEKEFWKKFTKYKINTFGTVAFMCEILRRLKFENFKLKNLKYITHAGGGINKDLYNYMIATSLKNKFKFISMYGQTEATSRIACMDWKFAKEKVGSSGKNIPGGSFFIKNKNNGEIYYEGKNIMMGYSYTYKDLKYKKKIKVLKTGDNGWIDKDGFLYILGRKDRYIKFFGNRINLEEIDNFLKDKKINSFTTLKKNHLTIYYTNNLSNRKIEKIVCKLLHANNRFIKAKKIVKFPLSASGKVLYKKINYEKY